MDLIAPRSHTLPYLPCGHCCTDALRVFAPCCPAAREVVLMDLMATAAPLRPEAPGGLGGGAEEEARRWERGHGRWGCGGGGGELRALVREVPCFPAWAVGPCPCFWGRCGIVSSCRIGPEQPPPFAVTHKGLLRNLLSTARCSLAMTAFSKQHFL